jgi:MYXO-CTERM domain-containing protein
MPRVHRKQVARPRHGAEESLRGGTVRAVGRAAALIAAIALAAAAPAAAAPGLLHVGDSLAVGSDPWLRSLLPGWDVTTSARKSRPTAVGVAIIDRRPSLPHSLVVELGTNDGPRSAPQFAAYVRHVLALAGAKRCVVWVNIHRPPYRGVSYAGFNSALDQIAATSPNLAVVDWNGMVRSGRAQVGSDGVHATAAGYQARAQAIAQALEGCGSQRAPGASHTIASAKKRHKAAAAPKRTPRPKPKPAARPRPIKVYTPSATKAAPAAATTRLSAGDDGTSPWPFIAGALAVVALAVAGYLLARRRRAS